MHAPQVSELQAELRQKAFELSHLQVSRALLPSSRGRTGVKGASTASAHWHVGLTRACVCWWARGVAQVVVSEKQALLDRANARIDMLQEKLQVGWGRERARLALSSQLPKHKERSRRVLLVVAGATIISQVVLEQNRVLEAERAAQWPTAGPPRAAPAVPAGDAGTGAGAPPELRARVATLEREKGEVEAQVCSGT